MSTPAQSVVLTTRATFAPLLSSLDPQLTEDGQPFGPTRYKEIARERYLISKYTNTSYDDTSKTTPLERGYILEFLLEDMQRQKDAYDKAQQEAEAHRKDRRR